MRATSVQRDMGTPLRDADKVVSTLFAVYPRTLTLLAENSQHSLVSQDHLRASLRAPHEVADEVSHGARGHEQRRFLAQNFRRLCFQLLDSRVFSKHVIPDLSLATGKSRRVKKEEDVTWLIRRSEKYTGYRAIHVYPVETEPVGLNPPR